MRFGAAWWSLVEPGADWWSVFKSSLQGVLEQPGASWRAHKRWGTLQREFGHFRGEAPPQGGRQVRTLKSFNILNTPLSTSFVVDASFAKFNTNCRLELLFGPPRRRQRGDKGIFGVFFIHIFFLQIFRLQCKKPYESLFRMDFPWGSMTTHKDDKFDDKPVNIGSFCLFSFPIFG